MNNVNTYQPRSYGNYPQNTSSNPIPKLPANLQTQKYSLSQQNYSRSFQNTSENIGAYQIQRKNNLNQSQKPLNFQKQGQIPSFSISQDQKLTPLQSKNKPKILSVEEKSKQYSKTTLKIVLTGFLILMLIMGSIYSLIWWGRMKTEAQNDKNQLTIKENSPVINEQLQVEKTGSNPSGVNQQEQQKTLQEDEQSPLDFLDVFSHKKIQKISHQLSNPQKDTIQPSEHHTLSQESYLQLRSHKTSPQIRFHFLQSDVI